MTETRPSQRIAAELRQQIDAGYYKPGQQLPSGTALMERYSVARQTVQNAIDQLRTEGLVVSRSGACVFVRDRGVVEKISRATTDRHQPHRIDRITSRFATSDDAQQADVTPGMLVLAVTRTTYDDSGNPTNVERVLVPAEQRELVYELPVG